MNIAVFDCPMGIAGDMTVGAFLDAGMPLDLLKKELRLQISTWIKKQVGKVEHGGGSNRKDLLTRSD